MKNRKIMGRKSKARRLLTAKNQKRFAEKSFWPICLSDFSEAGSGICGWIRLGWTMQEDAAFYILSPKATVHPALA